MKKVIVTDPCYLLSNDDWSKAIDAGRDLENNINLNTKEGMDNFNKKIDDIFFEDFGVKSKTKETGIGDWANHITALDKRVDTGGEFAADSGTVSVIEVNPLFENYLKTELSEDEFHNTKHLIDMGCLQVLEINTDEDLKFEIDRTNPQWSVVKVFIDNDLVATSSGNMEF